MARIFLNIANSFASSAAITLLQKICLAASLISLSIVLPIHSGAAFATTIDFDPGILDSDPPSCAYLKDIASDLRVYGLKQHTNNDEGGIWAQPVCWVINGSNSKPRTLFFQGLNGMGIQHFSLDISHHEPAWVSNPETHIRLKGYGDFPEGISPIEVHDTAFAQALSDAEFTQFEDFTIQTESFYETNTFDISFEKPVNIVSIDIPPYAYIGDQYYFVHGARVTLAPLIPVNPPIPEKHADDGPCVGNPINLAQGFKLQRETDFSEGNLTLSRIYRSSMDWMTSNLGTFWRLSYHRHIEFFSDDSGTANVKITNDRGEINQFYAYANVWISLDPNNPARFLSIFDGGGAIPTRYMYITPEDNKEFYDTSGKLARIEYVGGGSIDFEYDSEDRLLAVSDESGRNLVFTYNAAGNISEIATPRGAYSYLYDATNNLIRVENPDETSRTYHYEDSNFVNALTGVTDEENIRISTWAYDDQGRAVLSERAGGTDRFSVSYNTDGTISTTNPLGKQTTYHFKVIQGVRKVVQVEGHQSAHCAAANRIYAYNDNGYMTSKTDWKGNVTEYVRDGLGRATSITEAVGSADERVTTYTYHPGSRLHKLITEPGRLTDYDYDSRGRLRSMEVTDTGSGEVRRATYSYYPGTTDSNGNTVVGRLHRIDGPRTDVSDISTFEYDENLNLIRIANALGHEVHVSALDPSGRPLSIIDENGVITDFTYDSLGRLETQNRGGRTTSYQYKDNGLLERITYPDGRYYIYEYDPAQRLTAIQSATGERSEYVLDLAGNRIEEIMRSSSGEIFSHLRKEFDELNRVMASIESINGVDGRTEYSYDTNNDLETVGDPYNNITTYHHDALRRISDFVDAESGTTVINSNALDQQTALTAANGAHTSFTYNAFGDVLQEISPDRGATTYTYDLAGNLKTKTDARGITASYSYDALNRRLSISYPLPGEDVSFVYDSNPGGAIPCAFGIGRLCRVIDESGETHFSYDQFGNVTQRVHTELDVDYTYQFGYDDGDNLTSFVSSDGRATNFVRDSERRIEKISADINGTQKTIVSHITYRPDGQENSVKFGNERVESRTYDTNGLLQAVTLSNGPLTEAVEPTKIPIPLWVLGFLGLTLSYLALRFNRKNRSNALIALLLVGAAFTVFDGGISAAHADETLGYDLNKNIVSRQTSSGTATFQYDGLHRLTNEQGPHAAQSFSYDANGNRITDGQGAYEYAQDSNVLSSRHGNSVTHDAAGNIIDNGEGLTFEYNQAGRLKRIYDQGILVATYTYNAFGQRTRKVTASGTTVYHHDLDGQLIEESLDDGSPQVTYSWRGAKPTSVIFAPNTSSNASAEEKTVYLHTDHLNTPRTATVDNGIVVWSWHSDAFGSMPANSDPDNDGNPAIINLRFPGQYFDVESELHYNWNRYFDPRLGRFSQSDLIGLYGGINSYGYARANTLSYTDRLGLCPWCAAGVGAVVVHWTRNYWNEPISEISDVKEWTELLARDEAIYHRLGPGNDENRKFISPDGRSEAVFGCNDNLITDPLNVGTYNYFGPRFLGGYPHIVIDVVPYIVLGNSPSDMFNTERVHTTIDYFSRQVMRW